MVCVDAVLSCLAAISDSMSCTGTAAGWTKLPIISTDTNINICGYASHFFLIGSKLKF